MKKLSKITESAWGDMRRRSSGDIVRKENDVDTFDKEQFFYYVKDHYDVLHPENSEIYDSYGFNNIHVPIFFRPDSPKQTCQYIRYDNPGKKVYIVYKDIDRVSHLPEYLRFEDVPKDILLKLSDEFSTYEISFQKSKEMRIVYISPKDKSKVTNSFFIEVIDFILDNLPENEKGIEKKNVNESAWGEMRKRSAGKQIRREDDINLLDRDGLYDYLTSHYKPLNSFVNIQNSLSFNRIDVPVLIQGGADYVHFNFDNNSVFIKFAMPYKVKGLFAKLADNFSLRSNSDKNPLLYIISPKDGSETTNSFYIEVIDFIIDNIPDSFEKGVKKIVEESAWGEMRKRSSGEVVRKEDDIENLDRDGLYEYIFDLYEQINPFPTPLKSQISQTYTYFSIPIFKLNHKVYRLDCTFDNSKISKITLMANDADVKDFKQVLIDNFDCILRHDGALKITAKDGTVSNQVCMDLIKVIVENAPEPLLKKRD